MKRAAQRWGSVLLAVVLLVGLALPAAAAIQDKHTRIKVGYVTLPGFLYTDEGGYTGLAYELLQEMAIYNNWDYEYIPMSYTESYDALESGTIDLFVPYQRTAERQAMYEYSATPFCSNQASLLTLPESPLCFDDYAAMDGITIGAVEGTRNGQRFSAELLMHGANVTLKDNFDTPAQMQAALEAGEIDAFVSASNRGITNRRIIATLPETQSYVIARKGNREIIDKVDYALAEIEENTPHFVKALDEKYRIPNEGAYPSLNRGEVDFVAECDPVLVMLGPQDYDNATHEAVGSSATMLNELARLTGLTFAYTTRATTEEMYDAFTAGEADMVLSFNHDYGWGRQHNALLTNSYANFEYKLVRPGTLPEIKTMAVVAGTYSEYYVRTHETCTVLPFNSYREGIEAVLNGQADGVYCNSPIANYYSTFPEYSSLSFTSSYAFDSSYCVAIADHCDTRLVSVMDKALSCIPEKSLNALFEQQIYSRPISMNEYATAHPAEAAAIVAVVVILVALLCGSFGVYLFTRRKNKQLMVANSAKTDFLARMSHDIRTPMNAIVGMTLLAEDEPDLPPQVADYLKKIHSSSDFLLELVNDCLDLNKIESDKITLRPEPCTLAALTETLHQMMAPRAEAKGVTLNIRQDGGDRPLLMDRLRMQQIFVNLLNNAIKFTPAGGTVAFTVDCAPEQEGSLPLTLHVTDTGAGMTPEFMQKMYEPFEQEHRVETGADAGNGLGLAIVKNLVGLMGGTVACVSAVGTGTDFTVTLNLPLAPEGAAHSGPTVAATAQLQGRHVLLVEDHPLNTEIAVRLLQKQGITVSCAANGALGVEAFAASARYGFDAVLMDIRMPVMDGITAAKTIRALDRPDAKTVPIIAMTANAFDEDRKATAAAGMNAHLAKPIDPQQLYRTLAELIA